MKVTTIKLYTRTKSALDKLRNERESYDAVINKLVAQVRNKNLDKDLVEGYKAIGEEELKSLSEWESASSNIK